MAHNFLHCDREQSMLLPPDLRDWLAEDHLAWFLIDVVESFDLSGFYAAYRSDGHGRAAHDPQMMVALTLYAYATSERSSRQIERRCHEDIAYRVITANQAPDHATIARFRARHERALGDLFGQVLGLCAEAGLISSRVLAVDGTKLAASASERQNRTYEQIAREILEEAGRVDQAEDEIHGEARGDELPEHLAKREGRQAWIKEALRRQGAEREAEQRPVPRERADRLELCRERLVADWRAERQAHRDYEASRERRGRERGAQAMGGPPKPAELPAEPSGKLNLSDPDSRNMKTPRGYERGYNAQAVTTTDQIVVAAEVISSGSDFGSLDPMIELAEAELKRAGAEAPQVVVADAGYWSNHHIDRLRERGLTPLVAPDADSRKGPRRGRIGGPYDFMRRALASPSGSALYSKRQWMIEPVFGDIKENRRSGRFKRRGLAAARSEWRLLTTTHNLLKLHRHTLATA